MTHKRVYIPGMGRRAFLRRPRRIQPTWRLLFHGEGCRTFQQERDRSLVLQSRRIPYYCLRQHNISYFYAPALYENIANAEWDEFSSERRPRVMPSYIVHPYAWGALFFPLLLVLWHGVRVGWWSSAVQALCPVLSPALCAQLAGLGQVYSDSMLHGGQWYRALTALTLHSDVVHLLGNVAFGAVFLPFFCRRVGVGVGIFLVLLAGALGNAGNALMRSELHISMGFSTALFAAVGGMAGAYAAQTMRPQRASLLGALGAALAILAMLGTGGDSTDYGAHVWGLALGMLFGSVWQALMGRRVPAWGQWLAGALALAALAAAWAMALAAL